MSPRYHSDPHFGQKWSLYVIVYGNQWHTLWVRYNPPRWFGVILVKTSTKWCPGCVLSLLSSWRSGGPNCPILCSPAWAFMAGLLQRVMSAAAFEYGIKRVPITDHNGEPTLPGHRFSPAHRSTDPHGMLNTAALYGRMQEFLKGGGHFGCWYTHAMIWLGSWETTTCCINSWRKTSLDLTDAVCVSSPCHHVSWVCFDIPPNPWYGMCNAVLIMKQERYVKHVVGINRISANSPCKYTGNMARWIIGVFEQVEYFQILK